MMYFINTLFFTSSSDSSLLLYRWIFFTSFFSCAFSSSLEYIVFLKLNERIFERIFFILFLRGNEVTIVLPFCSPFIFLCQFPPLTPVLPKPPSPLAVSEIDSTGRKSPIVTGLTTICAIRSPFETTKSS